MVSSSFPVVNVLQMWCWIWYPAHKSSRLNTRRYFSIIHIHTHSPTLCVSYLMYRESEQNQTFNKVGLEKKVSRKSFLVHSSSENKPWHIRLMYIRRQLPYLLPVLKNFFVLTNIRWLAFCYILICSLAIKLLSWATAVWYFCSLLVEDNKYFWLHLIFVVYGRGEKQTVNLFHFTDHHPEFWMGNFVSLLCPYLIKFHLLPF